ncbi:sensor histidine kinase [Butyrivibrio sp. YAB3001]|uniref:sensor histidine kinase n=1 Tax=Butyrivibrio sp. YAB3001 TaxID=1520812 RepID=UPI0008F6685A|nr:sensor histidine kinase [Butyrivibrio sp. YAB3001]SFC59973.1 two-component system, sensor histidine kinase YesM [Butyrivibrio sp. YAB3001]
MEKGKFIRYLRGDSVGDSLSFGLKKVILGIVLVVILSFTLSTFIIAEKEKIEYSKRESENVLRTLSSNIATDMERYAELSRLIMTEDRLVNFLRADARSVDISMINDARYGVMDILNVTEGVDTVMVFREDMIMLITNRFTYRFDYDLMQADDWRTDIYAGKGKAVISLNSNNIAFKADNRPMVTIGRAIYDIDTQKRTGLMLMNVSAGIFDKMLGQLRYNDICILGEDGTFLAGNRDYAEYFSAFSDKKEVFHKKVFVNKRRALLSGCSVGNLPIMIVRVSPMGVKGIPFRVMCVLLFLLIVSVGLAVFTGSFIRKNITDPVFKLSELMEKNRQSGQLLKIDAKMPNSEFMMLEGDYNNMIDHVNELIDRLMEKEKILQKAEMRVLQEQIKPHFLYNSLETIGFMALEAGADNVHDAVETLGSFYRNFLSKGGREIPLSTEVRIVKDYLSLQKLRYGEILEDEYDIEEGTEKLIVPKLILQPLVENSIYHGIRLKGEKGIIKIKSFLEEKNLHIIVRDTGVGMSQEDIKRILSTDSEHRKSDDSESFGLWGTIERIRFYCGRDDVVQIRSEIGEYTEIEILIPAEISGSKV